MAAAGGPSAVDDVPAAPSLPSDDQGDGDRLGQQRSHVAAVARRARRRRHRLAQESLEGKLQSAFARIRDLECELAAAMAAAKVTQADLEVSSHEELVGRLMLVAPPIMDGIQTLEQHGRRGEASTTTSSLQIARRNVAAHHFGLPARTIASMAQVELNRVQRQARACRRPPCTSRTQHLLRRRRGQPAARTAAEAVSPVWTRKLGRQSSQKGWRFDLADRNRRAQLAPSPRPMLSGATYFKQVYLEGQENIAKDDSADMDETTGQVRDGGNEELDALDEVDDVSVARREDRAHDEVAKQTGDDQEHQSVIDGEKDNDEEVLEEFRRHAQAEEELLRCGDDRSRSVAEQALQRLLQRSKATCPHGHTLVVTTLVRHRWCDGPVCGGKSGEEALVLARCDECDGNLCLQCVARLEMNLRGGNAA